MELDLHLAGSADVTYVTASINQSCTTLHQFEFGLCQLAQPPTGSVASFNRDLGRGRGLKPVVPGPLEIKRAALVRPRVERDEWIGGDRGRELDAENFFLVIDARHFGDDVAREYFAVMGRPEARLHDM